MAIDSSHQLNNAREAISRDDKKTAQQILAGILNQDNQNIDAWLLLADILDNPEYRIDSLKHVLQINPDNVIAKRRLDELVGIENKRVIGQHPPPVRTSNSPPRIPKKKNNTWLILLGLLFLVAAGCVVLLFLGALMGGGNPPTSLPPHIVNDLYYGKVTVDYYIVVDKSFTKENAMKLITYYQSQHSGYDILNITFFCDTTYAAERFIGNIPDSEYYAHILYWYQKESWPTPGTRFVVDITNPDFTYTPNLGSACK